MALTEVEISSAQNTLKKLKRIADCAKIENSQISTEIADWLKILRFFGNDILQDFLEMEPDIIQRKVIYSLINQGVR